MLAVAVAMLGADSAGAQQQLETAGYTTTYPTGWSVTVKPDRGFVFHTIVSPGATVDDHWNPVPSAGGISVLVAHITAREFRKRYKRALPRRALDGMVGYPKGAKRVRLTSRPRTVKVDGAHAVAAALRYRYRGVENVQRDVIARHGRYLVLIEMNCRPDLEATGRLAMRQAVKSLKWK